MSDYENTRRNFISAAVAKLKKRYHPQPANQVDHMLHDLQSTIDSVLGLCRPIQQAGGAIKPDDIRALREHVFGWTLERFDKWPKEQLHMLVTTLIADRIMQQIDSDPWATGKPDQLSGI